MTAHIYFCYILHPGIVGAVATSGETVNIIDAYQDPRFNQAMDRKTNYVTRTILCSPVRDRRGNVVAVIQVCIDNSHNMAD